MGRSGSSRATPWAKSHGPRFTRADGGLFTIFCPGVLKKPRDQLVVTDGGGVEMLDGSSSWLSSSQDDKTALSEYFDVVANVTERGATCA
jgi:hypothetical protein